MLQKLPVINFEQIKYTCQCNENFIKGYIEESGQWYFIEVDSQYLDKLHEIHNNLPFLLERLKIEKVEKLVINLHDKSEYVIFKRNLKQVLSNGLVFKKIFIE